MIRDNLLISAPGAETLGPRNQHQRLEKVRNYMRNVKRTTNTILLPLESYLFLHEEGFRQWNERGETKLSEKHRERLTRNFHCHKIKASGLYAAHDGNFGGCKGDPHNAWEEGRWTSWSVSQMAHMLDEYGLPYEIGEPAEVIDVYI